MCLIEENKAGVPQGGLKTRKPQGDLGRFVYKVAIPHSGLKTGFYDEAL